MTTNLDVDLKLQRALKSLDGLSVGDAFGQSFFFVTVATADLRLRERHVPAPPWFYTDDTIMAISIVQCLAKHDGIDQDWLAHAFAEKYRREPDRGYGGTAHGILRSIENGVPWQQAAGTVFDNEGSCGNGGAMRAAPIGAYFADDDLDTLIRQAKASAAVTHAHPDGQTGAIAVALAASWFINDFQFEVPSSHRMIEFVISHLPQTETYWRLKKALTIPLETSPQTAALILGNSSQVISSDTVPFCLWCVCKYAPNYEEALWNAVSVHGDMDTNCAIIGSILCLAHSEKPLELIPREWSESREPLNFPLPPHET